MADPLRERLKQLAEEAERFLAQSARLPRIYHFDTSPYSETECLRMAEEYFHRWIAVLSRDPQGLAEKGISTDNNETWRQVSFATACVFVPLLLRSERILLGSRANLPTKWSPFTYHGINGWAKLCAADYGYDAAVERRLLSEFLGGMWHAHFMTITGSPIFGHTPQGWDEFIYTAIEAISDVSLASGKREHLLLGSLLGRALAARCQQATRERDKRDFELCNDTLGTLVAVEELSQLARRSPAAIQRYGKTEIETRFEGQLSLLMQSFGFLVVRTERAQRRIDLVCIAPGAPEASYTFLLEAKTTAANYALPTKDSRAIAEYVSSVRSALTTLPPLRLVIVVGTAPAKTIAAKVGALEAVCGIAIRYCNVALLQELRRQIPGPLDHSCFLKVCIEGGRILGLREMRQIIESDKVIRTAHNAFVQTLLARSSENT